MTREEVAGIVLARVIQREGGIADIGDGQGITSYGQTPAWLLQFSLTAPRTPDEAIANYQAWLVRTRLIGICAAPDALADGVIDFAVMSGHTIAVRTLQRALSITQDGVYGPATQHAVDQCDRGLMGRKIIADRLRFLGRLVTHSPVQNARWASGWCNRVAGQIELI